MPVARSRGPFTHKRIPVEHPGIPLGNGRIPVEPSRVPHKCQQQSVESKRTPVQHAVIPAGIPTLSCQRKRSEEHTSELQSLMRNSYAVFCLNKKTHIYIKT